MEPSVTDTIRHEEDPTASFASGKPYRHPCLPESAGPSLDKSCGRSRRPYTEHSWYKNTTVTKLFRRFSYCCGSRAIHNQLQRYGKKLRDKILLPSSDVLRPSEQRVVVCRERSDERMLELAEGNFD